MKTMTTDNSILKEARIKKMPNGKYRVLSEKGRNLGTYDSHKEARQRLYMIEWFKSLDSKKKRKKKASDSLDLTNIDDFSFSAIMRNLRKNATPEQVRQFLSLYKKEFDRAVKEGLQKSESVALQNAVVSFSKQHDIKLNKEVVKNAAVSELGDPRLVGKYLADIMRFTLNRIAPERRPNAINSLREKIYQLNERELAIKNLPPSSAIGQSITFVKHVLFNHDPIYIREVLNNITRNLQ